MKWLKIKRSIKNGIIDNLLIPFKKFWLQIYVYYVVYYGEPLYRKGRLLDEVRTCLLKVA